MSYARIQTHDGFVTVKDETHEHYAGEFGEHEKTSGWHGAEGNAAVMAALHADADQRVQELLHAPVGKGGKTRVVLLSRTTWRALAALRGGAGTDDPVFWSRKSGALDPSAVHRVVKAAAERAGLDPAVSAHWLRHAHASHALDRGAPIHLVQATLGHASVATTGRYLHARPSESSSKYLAV